MSFCTSPYGGHRPCYNRRCANQDCRNKAAWKEYTILVRSCLRLPPTHFATFTFPLLYYGWNSTQIINRFLKALRRQLPRGTAFHQVWRVDPQTKGRFPHVHMLIRSDCDITTEMIRPLWREIWDGEDVEADCRQVDDVTGVVQYFTKHGEDQKRIPKQEWQGRLSGGDRRFYVNTKKSLFTDEHYRQDYDTAVLAELEARLGREYPEMMGLAETPPARATEKEVRSAIPYSLFPPRVLSLHQKRFIVPVNRRRPCSVLILRYCVWTRAPP